MTIYGKRRKVAVKRSLRSPKRNTGGGSLSRRFAVGLARRIICADCAVACGAKIQNLGREP